MQIEVVKLGASLTATTEKMMQAAKEVIKRQAQGIHLVVVVSPMPALQRELRQTAAELTEQPSKREVDVLAAAGAQMTASLLAVAIQALGGKAVSLTGWQAGVQTNADHGNARIDFVDTERIEQHLAQGELVVVAGVQGINDKEDISSLGDGGSETSAVAIAVALHAKQVEIYSAVEGIYTADPQMVTSARKLPEISYDEMLEFANLGASILHPRAVELAKNYSMPIVVRAMGQDAEGTLIKGDVNMEKNLLVRGVAYESDIIRLTIGYESYETASLAEVFSVLAENDINVDIIVQAVIDGVKPTISFTIAKDEFAEALRVLESSKLSLGFSFADFEVGLAKVSIIGSGMASNPGVAARMFARLGREHIPVKMVSTSEIKVSVVVPQEEMMRAANVLHDEFNLAMKEASAS